MVPPQFFREFELPRLRRVFQALADAGATANWLHIAGPVQSILPYYAQAGVHIANFDYCVNVAEATSLLPTTCLDGNIKSLSFVEGSPAEIEAEARELLLRFPRPGRLYPFLGLRDSARIEAGERRRAWFKPHAAAG